MIYLAGYTGHKPDALARRAQALDAVVVDIRFAPRSRVPHWNKAPLERLLGDRYRWVHAFGNANYKGGPISLVDPDRGADIVSRMADRQNVILLCACAETQYCHREEVGELMRRAGHQVAELDWQEATRTVTQAPEAQPALDGMDGPPDHPQAQRAGR